MAETTTSRIGRPPTGRTGKSTNLYLDPSVKKESRKMARRYGQSLSDRVEVLLRRDLARERALVAKNATNRARSRHPEQRR